MHAGRCVGLASRMFFVRQKFWSACLPQAGAPTFGVREPCSRFCEESEGAVRAGGSRAPATWARAEFETVRAAAGLPHSKMVLRDGVYTSSNM